MMDHGVGKVTGKSRRRALRTEVGGAFRLFDRQFFIRLKVTEYAF